MWAHLQNWIVQDGEIPELYAGATLRDHAVRASCWTIQESQAAEGVSELPGLDPSGDDAPHYALTGTVERGRQPSSVLLRVGGFRVLAEPCSVRQVPGTSAEDFALERFSPDFFIPATGTRTTVVCRLEVMAEHETDDAVGLPDLRRDWVVRRLKLQRRALVPVRGRARAFSVDKVVRVDTIERMHRWADENRDEAVTYLLDLQPPGPEGP